MTKEGLESIINPADKPVFKNVKNDQVYRTTSL